MDDNAREIAKQLHDSQDKYTYFLLAAAGSCIALSVSRTNGLTPNWTMSILALAVIIWGASIISGVRNRLYHQSILYANFALLKIISGTDPEVGTHPERIHAASQGVLSAIESNNDRASFYSDCQLHLLILGAAFYLVWHVAEMFRATATM